MYRVLIVDDEEPVLDSYEFMLKSTGSFILAGKARTGYDALKLIYESPPDLVFMDINIPGMDGLAVIAEVHKKFASMVFILSTAYERFDLAQRAIPLGVFDYLVKPVSKKTFFAALEKVQKHLGQEPPGEAGIQHYLRKTIWKAVSPEEWEQYRERFAFPSDKGIVCLLELGGDAEKWNNTIMEKLSLRYHCRYDFSMNQGICLILGDIDREELEAQVEKVLRETLPGKEYACGIGGVYYGSELYQSCGEALTDLHRKRNGDGGAQNREQQRIKMLRRKTGIAPPEETAKLFNDLWKDVFSSHDFPAAKAKMAAVFMFLMDDCTGCYSGHPEVLPPFNAAEEIMALPDLAAWEAWAASAFEHIQRHANLRRSGSFPLPLVKAIEYIHDHYAESIQLPNAAGAAQVSAAYLSRLFSEHLKTNFIDYVTELRIGQAEKLIRESRMNIKEVAFAVGYQDPNYFSKIFKKITGLSPRAFGARVE
ncbi:DNA-binding response regulator [Spirochaetia bacterium]|nr:DNA-binding response regulator [Spirochaetia bacterium]